MPQLLDLPAEILCSLPSYIRNIEDYTNAASTCRTLRSAFAAAHPNTILRLAAASAPTFFSPHPQFLVMATARQVSDWAIGDGDRTTQLQTALRGGMDGLLGLCVEVAGLTVEDIRRLHLARFNIINPLADKIDKMAGKQWYATPNFWSGGVSEPYTIQCVADDATFQIIIYGELFESTMRRHLEPGRNLPGFALETRLEYVKYCIPDWSCAEGYEGMKVERTGPYKDLDTQSGKYAEDQVALNYVLCCGRWKRLWDPVYKAVGPDFQDSWRQSLWEDALLTMGLKGMELITVCERNGLSELWRERLRLIRGQIEALDETQRPRERIVSDKYQTGLTDAPNLGAEACVCCAAFWGA